MAKSALLYLRENLNQGGTFIGEYKQLSDADKEWYKEAARAEMQALGIEADAT